MTTWQSRVGAGLKKPARKCPLDRPKLLGFALLNPTYLSARAIPQRRPGAVGAGFKPAPIGDAPIDAI